MPVSNSVRRRLEAQGFGGLDDACGIATVWLVVNGWAFHAGAATLGYALGIPLVLVARLVSVTHVCIPSLVCNLLCKPRVITA